MHRTTAVLSFVLYLLIDVVVSCTGGEVAKEDRTAQNRVPANAAEPLVLVVMDPLCDQLACDCVAGYAQRSYTRLAALLQTQLGRQVEVVYTESLAVPHAPPHDAIDVVIGKYSVVAFDAAKTQLALRSLAMLSDKDGSLTQSGLFVVRHGDPAKSIEDLRGHRIRFGPADSDEKRSAALAALDVFGLPIPEEPDVSPSCSAAALAVVESEADAAVISSYAMPLLEGCGTVDKGALRIVGRTDPVPFVGVFVTDRVDAHAERQILDALLDVSDHIDLLNALESNAGFIRLPELTEAGPRQVASWADWRGPNRDATSPDVPRRLPVHSKLLWSKVLTGHGMAGVAARSRYVVVADKSLDGQNDVFRCLDADTGRENWRLEYPAAGDMDFTNSPRATPIIRDGLVYLLGAFGQLHCLKLESGRVVWKRNLAEDFSCKVPTWGYCSTPLLIADRLIVNPGAENASIVAFDRISGKVLWSTPGDSPGYASFINAQLGGVSQIVGYDSVSLCSWDPETGRRLWRLVPDFEGDFNVPSPIAVDGKLLVATENNGTRLYGFDRRGQINPTPLAASEDLAPDTSTPIASQQTVLGNFGGLVCLDLEDNLKTLWQTSDDPFVDYCSFIGGNGRVLVMTQMGELCLLKASKSGLELISRLDLFDDVPTADKDVWSHPALVGNRFYVGNSLAVYCFLFPSAVSPHSRKMRGL